MWIDCIVIVRLVKSNALSLLYPPPFSLSFFCLSFPTATAIKISNSHGLDLIDYITMIVGDVTTAPADLCTPPLVLNWGRSRS